MTNPRRGERTLALNGSTFTVRLTFNAVCEAEPLLGMSILDFLDEVTEGRTIEFRELRILFLSAVRGQHGIETLDDAGEKIGTAFSTPDGQKAMNEMASMLFESLGELFPQGEDEEGKP